ncbi:MAG: hypothetical protein K6G03_08325 [Lachnospiraceae bacterium]|nr:hypothetical protein [Lachnospiraceae bacterium]
MNNKVTDQDLNKVAGGAGAKAVEYRLIETKTGRVVFTTNSLEEAKETHQDYGDGYQLIAING